MNSMINSGILQDNLCEIYTALLATDSSETNKLLPLVTGSNHRLYYAQSLLGKWVALISRKEEPKQRAAKLSASLLHTIDTLFDRYVRNIYQAYRGYVAHFTYCIDQAYLSLKKNVKEKKISSPPLIPLSSYNSIQARELSEKEIQEVRYCVIDGSEDTLFFWRLFHEKRHQEAVAPLKTLLQRDSITAIVNESFYKNFNKARCLIHMEDLLEQPIPMAALAKLFHQQGATDLERLQVEKWLKQLNKKRSKLSVEDFGDALEEIIAILNIKRAEDHYLTIEKVGIQLEAMNCFFFSEPCPNHLQWRNGLKPGDEIECNGRLLTLGEQISPKKLRNDHYQFFTLLGKEHEDYVAKIGRNRMELRLEKAKAKMASEHWGFLLADIVEVDRNGYCMIIEKLAFSLDQYIWQSEKFELDEVEERMALIIASHLYCMWGRQATSDGLDPKYLMFSKDSVLKSTRLLPKGKAHYFKWEKFCNEISHDNFYVRSFLMHVSKLIEHPIAIFCRDSIEVAIRTGKVDVWTRRQPEGYEDVSYDKYIKTLAIEAIKLCDTCFELAKAHLQRYRQHDNDQDDDLRKAICQQLLELYRDSSTPGILQPSLQEEVVFVFILTVAEHPVTKSCRKAIEQVLLGQTPSSISLESFYPEDLIYEKYIKRICRQAYWLRQECLEMVKTLAANPVLNPLEEKLSAELLKLYQKSSSPSSLPSSWKKEVIKKLTGETIAIKDPIQERQKYYQLAFDYIQECNEAALKDNSPSLL